MNPDLAALLQELGISEDDLVAMQERGFFDNLGMTPEGAAQLDEAGVYDERAGLARRKTDFFQEQFGKPTQGDRMVSGYYVPRSDMGRLADLGHKGLSAYMMSQGMGGEGELIDKLKAGRGVLGRASAQTRLDEDPQQSKLEALLRLLREG